MRPEITQQLTNCAGDRQVQIRRMKDKLAFLEDERATVKIALGQLILLCHIPNCINGRARI